MSFLSGVARYLEFTPGFRGPILVEDIPAIGPLVGPLSSTTALFLKLNGRIVVCEIEADILSKEAGCSLYLQRTSADDVDARFGYYLSISLDPQPPAVVAGRDRLAGIDLDAVEVAPSRKRGSAHLQGIVQRQDNRFPVLVRRERSPHSLLPSMWMRRQRKLNVLALRPANLWNSPETKQSGAVTRASPSSASARLALLSRLRMQSRSVPRILASAVTTIGFPPPDFGGRNVHVCIAISTRLVAFSLSKVTSTVCWRPARPTSSRSTSARSIPDCCQRSPDPRGRDSFPCRRRAPSKSATDCIRLCWL